MSENGAFIQSENGAFIESENNARTGGGPPVVPAGVLFDLIYEGFNASPVPTYKILMNFIPQAAASWSPRVGYEITITDFDNISGVSIYRTEFLIIQSPTTIEDRKTIWEQNGYTFLPGFNEPDYYALEPWDRNSRPGIIRREMPIRPVGKAFASHELAFYNCTNQPSLGNGARRPEETFSDIETSLRACRIGTETQPATPPLVVGNDDYYLSHDYKPAIPTEDERQTGERFIMGKSQTTPYAPNVTPGSGSILIQDVGLVSAVGSFRAKCPTFTGAIQIEPVAVLAQKLGTTPPNPFYYNLVDCIELDTQTVSDPGYIDAGFSAGLDGGFAVRYDELLFGDLGGFDIYLTNTPKNADAILGNSPNFNTDAWVTLYDIA